MSDAGQISAPNSSGLSGTPENIEMLAWEIFSTLNTKSPRPAIKDDECFWLDGFFPIGPSNARTLPGVGPTVITASESVIWMGFGNIGDTSYGIYLQGDGSVYEFNTTTGAFAQIMPGGTIENPSSFFGFSQWGSQYLIFCKDQTNGYWLWDDTNLYTAGTVGPEVSIDATGSGYSSPPTVTVQTTGSGSGESYSAMLTNDGVSKVTVVTPGSGFGIGDLAILTFSGGGTDDQAVLDPPSISDSLGGLAEVYVVEGGAGYSSEANAGVDQSQTGGVNAVVSISIQNGTIVGVAIVNPGTGYISPPTITVFDPGIPGQKIPGGAGAQIGCALAFGQITAIDVFYGGTGYVALPVVKIIGDGTGAVAIPVISGGAVTGITMTQYGTGYTKALAVVEGGNNAANATPSLMPFGISVTTVEVYQSRVWVSNGAAVATFPPKNRTIFSDPNTPVGFSNGGGAFASTDSFLRVGYHWLKQTNGFLYLGGDSSVNNISNVQTTAATAGSSAIATTTFGNQNTDPQIGSPWPSSVQVFSRNIVFANSIGVYVSYGGAVSKASLPLDGFYDTGPIKGLTSDFSSAVATIFGIPVYMLLLPVVDQFTGQLVNKLLMYDGKRWFTSQQDRSLTFIAGQEINSVLTAWGTDGTAIFRLFQQPSTGFQKVIQSKLFSQPGYFTTKTAIRLSGVVRRYAVDQSMTVTIDNERAQGTGSALVLVPADSETVTVTNAVGHAVVITNASAAVVTITTPSTGIVVFGPYPIGQSGRMIGMTVQTSASDMSLLSLSTALQGPYTVNL